MKKLISFATRYIPRKYLQILSPIPLFFIDLYYRGSKYTCPVNGKSYRKFLPYGRINVRENALCPGSLSLERHRLMWLFLKDKSNFFTGNLDFLHIAPEVCFIDKFRELHGDKYITADIESPLADLKMDVHEIPFEDNKFDWVICNHVMEHVENDRKAMKEILRVLKPGGHAIMQIPIFHPIPDVTLEDPSITSPKEREKVYGQDDHVRMYGKDYPQRLEECGFKVEPVDYAKELTEEERFRYALPEDEIIYFCSK